MLLNFVRTRFADQKGFTLIELLVVILIIGILAAIAIPSFISQKDKAGDAAAKSFARNMQTAEETYFTSNNTYATTLAQLQVVEPVLADVPNAATPPTVPSGSATGFAVTATSKAGVAYTITRASTGVVTRSCTPVSKGGCNSGGSW